MGFKSEERNLVGIPLKPKLIVFLSHPIQHYVPWLVELSQKMNGALRVVYASRHGVDVSTDPEFGLAFSWDMELLNGYENEFYDFAAADSSPAAGFAGIQFPGIYEYLKRERPCAVMIFGWLYLGYWQVAMAAARLGIPYILRGESNLLNKGSRLWWSLKKAAVGRLCRRAGICLAIGSRNADLFAEYGVPSERIRIAPYFVDNEFFIRASDRLRVTQDALRIKFGLPLDKLVFVFMGKLIEKKHPEDLLHAWKMLPAADQSRCALLYAGSGAILDRLKDAARNFGDSVVFSGFLNREELPQAYVASDVLVLPSDHRETWGLVVNEAMACGLPVVVSDNVGCAPDLVIEGQTGYVYPCRDIEALSKRLSAMVQHFGTARRMGCYAREHVTSVASVEHCVEQCLSAISDFKKN